MHANSPVFKSLAWYGNTVRHRGSYSVLSRLRRMTRADIDAELVVERRGTRWAMNPSDFVHQDVFWHGTKDLWDVWHVERLLARQSLIVDIAAILDTTPSPLSRARRREPRYRLRADAAQLRAPVAQHRVERHGRPGHGPAGRPVRQRARARMAARTGNSGSAQTAPHRDHVSVRLETLDGLWPSLAGTRAADFIKIDVGATSRRRSPARWACSCVTGLSCCSGRPAGLAEAGSSPRHWRPSSRRWATATSCPIARSSSRSHSTSRPAW